MVTNDERFKRYGKAIEHLEVSIGFRDDAGDDDWASGTLERDDLNSIACAVMAVADTELAALRAEVERWQQKWKRRGMVIENLRPAAHDLQELRTHWLSEFERAEAAEAKVARVKAVVNDEYGFTYDAIRAALNGPPELEYPDLAYAVQKGGPNLDGPTVLTDEPTGDAMRWTKEDDK